MILDETSLTHNQSFNENYTNLGKVVGFSFLAPNLFFLNQEIHFLYLCFKSI